MVRRYVFPTLRLVIWAVIAVALVRIAFAGADVTTEASGAEPTGQVVEPTVEAVTGSITNAVTVRGAVVADPSVVVRATLAGTVSKLLAADGQRVDAGTPVLEIRQETPQDPITKTDPDTGETTVTERKPKVVVERVTAPVAGTLSLPTLKDQVVSVGDTVGQVAPGTLSVSGTLTADQQYRLVGAPTEAQVTLKGGPAPFTCTGLRIGTAAPAAPGPVAEGEGDPASAASGTVLCALPGDVTAFPGLGADLEIVNGTAADAVVVPVTAVQGTVQRGNVWVVTAEGAEPEEREVGLGLTDGEVVQITEGLALGDQVLEFVPVPGGDGEVDCGDPMQYDPMVCGG
ncbi:efflux RND transporter periplasmic adaptor subunit [Cellulomonas wangsupingiae]|uniref:Efflux RND transporter periplasmic adaptor subunit n=1 Tax=Cellulomonas wangsupingiae TaxID=2968085 RepID=A0ABY5K4G6_9CELL|nr:efflux RND transporter periplasmic adaptor subunit [Cellulomonas wangsupingiae]MCC2335815.1 efflux RND transporter periplasmic adaptor subunit [Cellulomonas wangsupingiae]UUI64042.1 efflux RND transporter periplasmic adaptor subunit [Cellulomonas wangsupingiae]